jgi:ElaA protein
MNALQWTLKPFLSLSVDELYSLMQLRQEVFIVEQNCPYLDADGKDKHAHHLMGYKNGKLVAYARLLPPGVSYTECSIGRVLTATNERGKAFGQSLMVKAIEEMQNLYRQSHIRIGAQQYLKAFYESFGFEQEGEPYLEDGIPHIIMLRQV